jgi:hypothetical protein
MNRSVVTYHWTARWCSQRATSRCTADGERPRRSGRVEKGVAGTTSAWLVPPPLQLQPDQEAVGQHHRDGMPVEARPQSALVPVPPHLSFGLVMKLCPDGGWVGSCGRGRFAAANLSQGMAGLPSPNG